MNGVLHIPLLPTAMAVIAFLIVGMSGTETRANETVVSSGFASYLTPQYPAHRALLRLICGECIREAAGPPGPAATIHVLEFAILNMSTRRPCYQLRIYFFIQAGLGSFACSTS